MILEDVVEFFREAPPLSLLEPGALMDLARRAGLDFYPGGTPVLGSGQAGEGFVLVVKKGRLRVDGEDYGEGSVLGWAPGAGVVTEDAVCYLLPPRDVAEALRARPELLDFLEGRLSAQVLEIGLAGIVREIPAWLTRRPLATVSAGDVVRVGEPVPYDMSIRQAAAVMTETFRDVYQRFFMQRRIIRHGGDRNAQVVTEHEQIAQAFRQGDPEGARNAIVAHAKSSKEFFDSIYY